MDKRVRDLAHEIVRQRPWISWSEAVESATKAVGLVTAYVRINLYKGQFNDAR